MTMTFKVIFHRYRNGQSRHSAPHWVQTEDFYGASRIAQHMLSAMKETDPASNFVVASITTDGLRGDHATSGWETNEEMSMRLGLEVSPA